MAPRTRRRTVLRLTAWQRGTCLGRYHTICDSYTVGRKAVRLNGFSTIPFKESG